VRLSGPGSADVVMRFCKPLGGRLRRRPVRVELFDEQGVFDDAMAVFLPGPRTYTGEDVAEITCHGNPIIVDRLLAAAGRAGARLAQPGEFTRKAVEHGKLDLLGAESVDHVTRASSPDGLRIARSGLDGSHRAIVAEVRQALVMAAAELEARLDYPSDELALEDDATVVAMLEDARARAVRLVESFSAGRILVEGATVALVGAVNAGKSSLFNALVGRHRALVHHTPGTTRDVVEAMADVDGLRVRLLDTAGERHTNDPVEAAGLALAKDLVAEADLLVVVLPAAGDRSEVEQALLDRTADRRRLVVVSQIDNAAADWAGADGVLTSARTGQGIGELRMAIRAELVRMPEREGLALASARQRDLWAAVAAALDEGLRALPVAGVAVCVDAVVRAVEELDALTGADAREDVLSALFARFCIGK